MRLGRLPVDTTSNRCYTVSMTTTKYEIIDGNNPTWKGMRFSTLERAERELAKAVAAPGRFYIIDRSTRKKVGA